MKSAFDSSITLLFWKDLDWEQQGNGETTICVKIMVMMMMLITNI